MAPLQSSCARAGFASLAFLLARSTLLAAFLSMAGTLATAAAPALFPSQFNGGTQVDTAVLGTRIPVLLIHGLGGSTEGWEPFLRAYEQNPAWRSAFKPYTFRCSACKP